MPRLPVTPPLGLALSLLVGCSPGRESPNDMDTELVRREVSAMLEALRRYAAAGQWDSLLGLYADDPNSRWHEDGRGRYSIETMRKGLTSLPPGSRVENTYRDTEIVPVAPGVATVFTLFETRVADSTGSGFSFDGVISMTVVKRKGTWQIIAGHTSSGKR